MPRPPKPVTAVLVWSLTTAVAAFSAWLGMRPVLAAAILDDGLPVPISEVHGAPSFAPSDSATSRVEPRTLDGWHEIRSGVWEQGFHTEGGSVTIRAARGKVTLISATPRDGFAVLVDDEEKTRLLVRFHRGDEVHTVDAMWWNGGPYAIVEESG
ncbi:hypothetical protein [Phytomonospora endophytica]|uniref:Uncharacterized protein n=1 Tax=Phytomonospora endophytica TaxID=714109 RepID=A0A841FJ69_9ACTN|nr:hypothetical protein [Phytomonospora endophytica]MBB6034993.1 hypothetical protein [Phytomonospora endophytica]GIG71434.1 hypothetical protein Pen01_77290 [Phytomonospora endophytica]